MIISMKTESKRSLPLLGSHMSVAGGVHTAFERAAGIGCLTMQVFVKNASQWFGKPATDEDVSKYKTEEAKTTIRPVVAHAAYLINLCATDEKILKLSQNAFVDELKRCEMFGIHALIFHPGAHLGAGESEGVKKIAESINLAHEKTKNFRVLTTLECTAGQGSAIGYRFEHLHDIIQLVDAKERMAVCLDTCHLFAAGYDIGTEAGWGETIHLFNDIVGLDRLAAIHVNDSKRERGSRVDRHHHIGKGMIGLTGFRMLMRDERLKAIPKILETEKGNDMREDVENMSTLKSLLDSA